MSCGSRATQVKPEALVILFRATPESASFLRVTVGLCPRAPMIWDFHMEIFFRVPWTELHRNPRTGAQYGAESALR
jgi:hypothetical protein